MSRPLVIYHKGCPDGAGAAYAAWLKLGDHAEYVPAQYGDPPPDCTNRPVYILDFSYKRAVLEAMRAQAGDHMFKVIDHHKTAQEDLAGLDYAVFDMDKSGAVLAWEYFRDGEVPELLLYIQDRDLWKWELPESREVSATIDSYGVRDDFRKLQDLRVPTSGLAIEGRAILRYQKQLVEAVAKKAYGVVWAHSADEKPLLPLVACSPVLQSEVGEVLAERSGGVFGVVWQFDGVKQQYIVSLRSRGEGAVDVSEVAKQYGGGGHKNAAGFTCGALPWA